MTMISKLVPVSRIIEMASHRDGLSTLECRWSGDTHGKALEIIGNLMQLNTPYVVSVKGMTNNHMMDEYLLKRVRSLVETLELDYFTFSRDMTISYDIWHA